MFMQHTVSMTTGTGKSRICYPPIIINLYCPDIHFLVVCCKVLGKQQTKGQNQSHRFYAKKLWLMETSGRHPIW